MLRRVSAVKAQRAAETSYGVAEADLTPWQGWSLPDLRRTWNEIKAWVAPWWVECSKEAFNTGLANLCAALTNWHASKTGARQGRRMRWPRMKKKRARRTARFTTGAIRVDPDFRHVVLPRLGRIRTCESTRKLGRRVRAGTAQILSATVTESAGRWSCSLQVAVARTIGRPAHAPKVGRVVGVDAGIKHLAVLSTGEMVANPAPFKAALKRLGKAQRRAARRIGPLDPATLRRQLTYKTRWYASTLHTAGRWYPSSKTCSACKTVKPKLSLAERTFNCEACGMSLDRDINAARNLADLVRHVDLELPGDVKTGRGSGVSPVRPAPAGRAVGVEASRPSGVNVVRQRTATNHVLTNA
jgi:transposase